MTFVLSTLLYLDRQFWTKYWTKDSFCGNLVPTKGTSQMDYSVIQIKRMNNIQRLYHSFMYSLVSLLASIYPLPAMHSLLVALYNSLQRN